MKRTTYTVIRIPNNDWENLMETVTLDSSYSDEIKNEVWKAIDNLQFYSNPWVVIKLSKNSSNAKIFNNKDSAQKYFLREQKKLIQNEQVFYIEGKYMGR